MLGDFKKSPLDKDRRTGHIAGNTARSGTFCKCPRSSLPGSTANTTASSPTILNTEASATSLKAEPSLASPVCPGPAVTSQVRGIRQRSVRDRSPHFPGEPGSCPQPSTTNVVTSFSRSVCAMVPSPEGLASQCSSAAFPLRLGWALGANRYGVPPSSGEVVHSAILTHHILSAGFQLGG